jgi:probable rRNA maturation factor
VALPPGETGQVSLLITDDVAIRELNREFRGLDEVTDVLSFSPSHPGHWEGEAEAPDDRYLRAGETVEPQFVLPPGEVPVLGDIVVSYPQAQRQAQAGNESVDKELALLIIHGVLHLVGYDHLEPEETALMQSKERAALSLAFSHRQSVTSSTSPEEAEMLEADG